MLFVALACTLLLFLDESSAIRGGSPVNMCDYPGMVAVTTADDNTILCSGVIQARTTLYLAGLCRTAVELQLEVSDVLVRYGDGSSTITLPQGSSLNALVRNGIYRITMPEPFEDPCGHAPARFKPESMDLNPSSCVLVGFGADIIATQAFDAEAVQAVPVIKSTGASCCSAIRPTIPLLGEWIIHRSATFNCLTSPGAPCGMADVGAPIFCDSAEGERVLIALTASARCNSMETFVAHDLTTGGPGVKFGIPSL